MCRHVMNTQELARLSINYVVATRSIRGNLEKDVIAFCIRFMCLATEATNASMLSAKRCVGIIACIVKQNTAKKSENAYIATILFDSEIRACAS
mmetsp:Transcript_11043/g.29669  ORF Transcript_11043/g.29669 Transcript_11043/m.29669 type:complete len:94 (-) Transcript_11043:77-358(-)